MMKSNLKSLAKSFRYAYQGVRHCVLHERNFRIHLTAAAYALFLAHWLELAGLERAVLLLTIASVLVMELLNTAVEAIVDHLSPARSPWAKIAKDTAAGAVLFCALTSVAVGIWLLWRPEGLRRLALLILTTPLAFILCALSMGLAVWFIFGPDGRSKKGEL